MKRKKSTIILLFLACFMVAVMTGCSTTREAKSKTNVKTGTSTAQESSKDKNEYKIGETYNEDGLKVTIVSCGEEEYEKYDGGKIHLLKAFVKVENDSNESVSITQANFDCYVNNKATDFSYYGKEEGLGLEKLSPGRYKEGYLYIEATKDDAVELEFASSWYPDEDEKIIFKLTE